ncbi:MAG: ImmA/IrrE family metallo-endopeptidase [Clostridia bacterium]|nr:ImmA/IrrE family metallo-endopeptidase [Clostridia bacterium]
MTSKAEIQSRVFLQARNITKYPLDLEEVVKTLQMSKHVKIIYDYTLDDEIDAYLYESKRRLYIVVNGHRPPERQRFTIAHEIGHLYIGHEPVRINGWDMHEDYQEDEANDFAAGLLMPASRVYTLAEHHRNVLQLLEVVKKYFDVSLAAAAKRITNLDIFRGAILLKDRAGQNTYFNYRTSDFYDDNEYRFYHEKKLPGNKLLHVLVAETYRHVVRWEIG